MEYELGRHSEGSLMAMGRRWDKALNNAFDITQGVTEAGGLCPTQFCLYYKGPTNPKVTVKWQLSTCPSCPTLDKFPQSGRGRDTGYHLVPQPWPVTSGLCEKQPGFTESLGLFRLKDTPSTFFILKRQEASFVKGQEESPKVSHKMDDED